MRLLGNLRDRVVPAAVLLAAFACGSANASEIKQLRIEVGATGTRAELHLDKAGEYRLIPLSNPERLAGFSRQPSGPRAGLAAGRRDGEGRPHRPARARHGAGMFDLAGKVKAIPTTLDTAATGAMLVLEWPGDGASVAAHAAAPARHWHATGAGSGRSSGCTRGSYRRVCRPAHHPRAGLVDGHAVAVRSRAAPASASVRPARRASVAAQTPPGR